MWYTRRDDNRRLGIIEVCLMALAKEKKLEIIQNFGANGSDTGSSAVQVALLTNRIESLTEHCQQHKKDFSTKRGLLKLVCQRRSLLRYLANTNEVQYKEVIQRLGLRK